MLRSSTCAARHALLLLCLAVFPASDTPAREQPPTSNVEIDLPCEFVSLKLEQARQLQGRFATFRVSLNSPGDREGKFDVYACEGDGDIERSLWMMPDEEAEDEMTVKAVLLVIEHAPRVIGNVSFEGFLEFRLTCARRYK